MTFGRDDLAQLRDEADLEAALDECHGRPVGGPGSLSELLHRAAAEIEANHKIRRDVALELEALVVAVRAGDLPAAAVGLAMGGVARALRHGIPAE